MAKIGEIPVLIAGGGPVGMTLGLFLAHYGVRSILVERNPETTRHPKMDLTNGRSMELFKRVGIADKLRDAGVPRENSFDITWVTSVSGHELHRFKYPSANEARDIIRLKNDGSQASEPGLRVSQVVIEPVLEAAIDSNPLIDVRFGVAMEKILDQDCDGVSENSPIVFTEPGAPPIDPVTYRPNTWPGARLPHVFLDDGVSLHDRLGRFFTLIFLDRSDPTPLVATAEGRGVPMSVVTLNRPELRPIYERNLLLVRPDQHIAWRGDHAPQNADPLLAQIVGA
jgi:hypothetical protein